MPSSQHASIAVAEQPIAIQVTNLRKTFTSKHSEPVSVLNGISFSATAGEIVGVFGPSGCGKTTLLRILCGVLPYEGKVLLFNRTAREQRGTVAYVPQRAELLYWRILLSNALLGWDIKSRSRRTDPLVVARAQGLFERFRLTGAERKYPLRCSGGERQRTALIRALLTPAPVLALDEPVGAIDHITRADIYQTLLDLVIEDNKAAAKKTVTMVSHDPEELLFLCDRVLVIPNAQANAIANTIVPFARPRQPELKFTPEFVVLKKHLWGLLI